MCQNRSRKKRQVLQVTPMLVFSSRWRARAHAIPQHQQKRRFHALCKETRQTNTVDTFLIVNISVREKTQHERLYLHMFYFRQITIENFTIILCERESDRKRDAMSLQEKSTHTA